MQANIQATPFANGVPHLSAIASAIETMTQHSTVRTAPFAQMVRSKLNVRQKNTNVSTLKALIAAQGLLQNLIGYMQVVDGRETGIVEIVAGGRRLQSLGELIAEGVLMPGQRHCAFFRCRTGRAGLRRALCRRLPGNRRRTVRPSQASLHRSRNRRTEYVLCADARGWPHDLRPASLRKYPQ